MDAGGMEMLDGAGNVKSIGSNSYGYDVRNRLTSSTVNGIPSTFTFDKYGNLTSAGLVNTSTNHLASGIYDALGNLTSFSGKSYAYDDFSRQTGYTTSGETYVYDAADERVARVPSTNTPWYVTLRDDGNHLASEYSITSGGYSRTKDYFRFGSVLATTLDWVAGSATYWVEDHLGTPRYGRNPAGVTETHDYQPFGQEIGGSFGSEPLKFAKMERDQSSGNDYDHARYHVTGMGRFLGVDKHSGFPEDPMSWNRYRYARDNPIKLKDEDGLAENCPTCGRSETADLHRVEEQQLARTFAIDSQGLGHPDAAALEAVVFAGETAAAIDSGGATTILFATSSGLAAAGNPNNRLGAAMIAGGTTLGLAKVPAMGPEGVLGPVVAGFGAAVQQKLTSGAVSFEKTALTIGTSFFTFGLNVGTQAGEVGTAVVNSAGKAFTFGLSVLGGSTQITKPNQPPPSCKPGTPGCAGLVPGSG